MRGEHIIVESIDNIRIVKINHPETLNALNTSVLKELRETFITLRDDSECDIIILTGEGRAFVAGADISEMCSKTALEAKAFAELGDTVFREIELMDKIVIAAINGFALGGGCELALACDIRIASLKAKFGQPEVGLGIIPGFCGTVRLPRIVGVAKAKELIYTADIITAEQAFEIGLVNKVVAPESLMEEALLLAKRIASKGQIAVRYAKEAINRGMECDIDNAITIEQNLFSLCFATEDQKEGMNAFLNKCPVRFIKK